MPRPRDTRCRPAPPRRQAPIPSCGETAEGASLKGVPIRLLRTANAPARVQPAVSPASGRRAPARNDHTSTPRSPQQEIALRSTVAPAQRLLTSRQESGGCRHRRRDHLAADRTRDPKGRSIAQRKEAAVPRSAGLKRSRHSLDSARADALGARPRQGHHTMAEAPHSQKEEEESLICSPPVAPAAGGRGRTETLCDQPATITPERRPRSRVKDRSQANAGGLPAPSRHSGAVRPRRPSTAVQSPCGPRPRCRRPTTSPRCPRREVADAGKPAAGYSGQERRQAVTKTKQGSWQGTSRPPLTHVRTSHE